MAVAIVLDPTEVASGRTQLTISDWVASDVDFGDAAIEAYMAEAARGQLPIDYRIPNRIITIPLRLKTVGATSFATIRTQIQAKAGLFQREGGWLKRTSPLGDVFTDVVGATLHLGGSGFMENVRQIDVDATLTLECLPEWYQAEIDLGTTSETAAAELRKTMTTVKGNYPGRARIVVNELQGVSQLGLIWGLRSEHYSSATTAALAYEAELLTPRDTAKVSTAVAGASAGGSASSTATVTTGSPTLTAVTPTTGWANGMTITGTGIPASTTILGGGGTSTMTMSANATGAGGTGVAITGSSSVMRHSSLASGWTPVLATGIRQGGLAMTHVGTYRVWARCYSTAATPPRVRFVWDVGDLTLPVANDPVRLPGASNFYDLDLGEVRLDAPPVGTYRWEGVLQGQGSVGGEDLSVDKLWFVPVDDGYGVLRASLATDPGLEFYFARDEFNQTAGALTGQTPPVGVQWAGAGDADDFAVNATLHIAERTAVSDGGASWVTGPRLVTVNATLSDSAVQADVGLSARPTSSTTRMGVLARYVDASNYLEAGLQVTSTNVDAFTVNKVVAGTATQLGVIAIPSVAVDAWYTIRLAADSAGRWFAWLSSVGATLPSRPTLAGVDASLATGGTLDDGKPGLFDWHPAASASTRHYDNFSAWDPAVDAVAFASQSLELRSDGVFREDSTGTAYGPITPLGDLPRLPPSGLEARTVELFVKASRGDLDLLPDTNIDDLSVQVLYRPSWLYVPEA